MNENVLVPRWDWLDIRRRALKSMFECNTFENAVQFMPRLAETVIEVLKEMGHEDLVEPVIREASRRLLEEAASLQ